jgi:hypothetical protein
MTILIFFISFLSFRISLVNPYTKEEQKRAEEKYCRFIIGDFNPCSIAIERGKDGKMVFLVLPSFVNGQFSIEILNICIVKLTKSVVFRPIHDKEYKNTPFGRYPHLGLI